MTDMTPSTIIIGICRVRKPCISQRMPPDALNRNPVDRRPNARSRVPTKRQTVPTHASILDDDCAVEPEGDPHVGQR